MSKEVNSIITKEFLEQEYVTKQKSMKKIGKEIGCSESWIWHKLKHFNILRRNKPKYIEKTPEELSKILTKEFLEEHYVNKKLNSYRIAELIPCNSSTVRDYLNKYHISIRGIKGKDNYRWKGGITPLGNSIRNSDKYFSWFLDVLKRDNKCCQKCSPKNKTLLEVHHIKEFNIVLKEFLQTYSQFSPIKDKETLVRLAIGYSPFWDVSNGLTLCYNCHTKIHKKDKKHV